MWQSFFRCSPNIPMFMENVCFPFFIRKHFFHQTLYVDSSYNFLNIRWGFERHSFAIEIQAANNKWITTFLNRGGSMPSVSAGVKVFLRPVISDIREKLAFQNWRIAAHPHRIWKRLPTQWQSLQHKGVKVGSILCRWIGIIYHLCRITCTLSQWSTHAEALILIFIANCHCCKEKTWCNYCSHSW